MKNRKGLYNITDSIQKIQKIIVTTAIGDFQLGSLAIEKNVQVKPEIVLPTIPYRSA